MPRSAHLLALALAAPLLAAPLLAAPSLGQAGPETPVSLELVLAVDRSLSAEGATLALQLDGHAAAFRHPLVVDALTAGGARVAITLVSWSDPNDMRTVVPWTLIADAGDAARFADLIDTAPREAARGSTGLGAALVEAAREFDRNGFAAQRRVVDVVANGYSNVGIWPEPARDAVVARGVTVNGLAILDEVPWLGRYFEERVIGGPGAFVRTVSDAGGFVEALVEKLVREVAGREAPDAGRG